MPRDVVIHDQPAAMSIGDQRLICLADHLGTVSPSAFDIGTFSRCAVWHACQVPELQDDGLRIVGDSPFYDGCSDWDAVTRFFMISYTDARKMFTENAYRVTWLFGVTPRVVAKRIREVVASHHTQAA